MLRQSRYIKFNLPENTEDASEQNNHSPAHTTNPHSHFDSVNDLIPLNRISVDALIQALVDRNVISHRELSDCETRLSGAQSTAASSGQPQRQISERARDEQFVWIQSNHKHEPVRFKFLRKILGRQKWGRKVGSALFGWKWRRKGGHSRQAKYE